MKTLKLLVVVGVVVGALTAAGSAMACDDYVYVGPLHGCSGLDDAIVEATYNQ